MTQMSSAPFQIKICGVTRLDDALMIRDAGADAIGLNFYPRSPRCVDLPHAERIADSLAGQVKLVGVFVNQPPDWIARIVDRFSIDLVQLHGDEPLETVQAMGAARVVRALRCREQAVDHLGEVLAELASLRPRPAAALLDAYSPDAFGGTGRRLDWREVSALTTELSIVLAGGLTADNVSEAIMVARPSAVDTASGVESAPGVKDAAMVSAFVRAARSSFDG